jgi:indolepyruvate ferredoxin oxidoreductase beta subunit
LARDTVGTAADPLSDVPAQARSPKLQPLLDRVRRLAAPAQKVALEGVRRAIDYQDPEYAKLYLDRLERVAALDGESALTEATARSLALWMTFEDTIRVADLKTRSTRFARVRDEIRADPGQLFGITEFMKPRVTEIAGTLPAGLGRWVLRSPGVTGLLTRWTGGKQIRTGTVTGFLMLHMLGGLKRWRRGTLRFHEESERIEQWLGRIEGLAATNYGLAVELAKAQRLVKGYGDTHERGLRNFSALVDKLDELASRPDGAAVFARLQAAALADEEGKALARELAEISSVAVVKGALERARA